MNNEDTFEDFDEIYYKPIVKVVMVPVVVYYHEPTGVIYKYDSPTLEGVDKALEKELAQNSDGNPYPGLDVPALGLRDDDEIYDLDTDEAIRGGYDQD